MMKVSKSDAGYYVVSQRSFANADPIDSAYLKECRECLRGASTSIDEAIGKICHAANTIKEEKGRTVIAISGKSASGKSALAKRLHETHGYDCIELDIYRLPREELSQEKRPNFDHPCAFDFPLIIGAIAAWQQNKWYSQPIYDHIGMSRVMISQHKPSSDVLVIEGIVALNPMLNFVTDYKVFCSSPRGYRLHHRILRDRTLKERTPEESAEVFFTYAEPTARQHIIQYITQADLVVRRI